MKKIATLLLAAGLLFSAAGMAQAIDFKIRGQWIMAFDYGEHGAFTGGNGMTGYKKGNEDNFEARQRLRLQLDAVASESLAGSIIFEMGDQIWGQSATGGALGADGTVVEVKNAWLDWMVPDTDIKVRMGLQGIALPSMTTGSQVWCDDAAGITASWQINENVALTGLWARLYNDNFQGYGDDGRRRNYMDNVDVAALLLPLTFDGFRLTPWAMYAGIGPNSFNGDRVSDWRSIGVSGGQYRAGMLPAGGAAHNSRMDLYGNAFWAGLTGDGLTLRLAPKGAGSENKSVVRMLVPADGIEGVRKVVLDAVLAAGPNSCPPLVVGVGLGGTMEVAALCAKRAAARDLESRNPDPRYAAFEDELLELINRTGIGPQGLGGETTALKVHVEWAPTHIASLPVAVNINCHAARHAEVRL